MRLIWQNIFYLLQILITKRNKGNIFKVIITLDYFNYLFHIWWAQYEGAEKYGQFWDEEYYSYFANILYNYSNGKINYIHNDKIDKLALFPQKVKNKLPSSKEPSQSQQPLAQATKKYLP